MTLEEVCNKNCFYVYGDDFDKAKLIFADNPIVKDIPIITQSKEIKGLISREQVFWKQFYRMAKLPRMHYAYCIYNAAYEAKSLVIK